MNNRPENGNAPVAKMSPPVLYYHSAAPAPFENWVQRFLTLPIKDFEEQLIFLHEQEYRYVFLEEWMNIRSGSKPMPRKEICIAFDDGLLDNWVYVWPLAIKYDMKFTLFVCPECVAPGDTVRPTLKDVWEGYCKEEELQGLGYLNWAEIKAMQDSGYVDIQSHTMTHAKYPVSGKITGFYYGGFPGMHPILNAHPEIRSTYMNIPDFESMLPKGSPLFEEKSAVIARRIRINPEFLHKTRELAETYDEGGKTLPVHFEREVQRLRDRYERQGNLISHVESDHDLTERLHYEITRSKQILEERLSKPVDFLCWPHGDNSQMAHDMAISCGYKATTSGKMRTTINQQDRIPRFGTTWNHGLWLNRLKLHYKISSHYHRQPYYALWLLNEYKNRLLGRN